MRKQIGNFHGIPYELAGSTRRDGERTTIESHADLFRRALRFGITAKTKRSGFNSTPGATIAGAGRATIADFDGPGTSAVAGGRHVEARLVITAVVLEGRSKSAVAGHDDGARCWVSNWPTRLGDALAKINASHGVH